MKNLDHNGLYFYGNMDYNMNIPISIKKNMFLNLNPIIKDV